MKVIEAEEVVKRTGYSRPHTAHCGPDGIYMNALGSAEGEGPGGIFVLDPETFEIRGRWESDRGPQHLAYDFWWHLGHDTMITSEWGTPNMVEAGVNPELLLGGKYGHALHVWDLRKRDAQADARSRRRAADGAGAAAGAQSDRDLRLRRRRHVAEGSLVVDLAVVPGRQQRQRPVEDSEGDRDPGAAGRLPSSCLPLLKGFGAVPPLVTDINLSLDDRFLYVSCWGTGELRQYDVSDPFNPVLTGTVEIGGIVRRAAHPRQPDKPLNGGPQMVEISRDGRRVYLTNSLYRTWDEQFYPDGIRGWIAKLDVNPRRRHRPR